MEQRFYFNATCDPVDLTLCFQFYVDPCDCTKYYQCAQNQRRMFPRSCGLGTIYSDNILVCDHPENVICDSLRPWERCNVTESRMRQLPSICGKNIANDNNPSNSDPNTNGIDVQMMQTILPSIAGVLVCAILIGFVINRHKRSCAVRGIDPDITERPYDSLDLSRMTSESRLGRNGEIHLSDPYNSYDPYNPYHWSDSSVPEYCPSETHRFNPEYGVDPTQPSVSSSPTMSQRNMPTTQYVTPRDEDSDGSQPAPTISLSTIPHLSDVQSVNTLGQTISSEGSSYLSVTENDSTPRSSEMPEQSDDDREFTDRGDQNGNKPEGEIVSNEDGFYSIVEEPVSTPDPSAMPRVHDADREFRDREIPRRNTHEEEIASSEGSSYELVLPFDPTTRLSVMTHPCDADREFTERTVSSEDSAFVVVEESGPLFHPYISGNGPWHHKVIFNIKEHYFP